MLSDNGKEFVNKELRALCKKDGINLTLSPSLSPWSNGGNERRHAVIDISIKKLLEDDPTLDLQDAIDHACFARNNEVGPLGFFPQQLT